MKVLFISAWYPHRNDPMSGLFVQKHAEAVSLLVEVKVLFVYPDVKIKRTEIVCGKYNQIDEIIVYFPKKESGLLRLLFNSIEYIKAYLIGFKRLKDLQFKPDIVHANVLNRTAFIAYIYKLISGTPYVITEHWSRLLKERSNFNGGVRKLIAKTVVRNSSYILPVSNELLKGIAYHNLLLTKHKVVENVVDNCFFETYQSGKRDKIRLLNVSCFTEESKNLTGLLRTVKEISLHRNDFEFVLVGEGEDLQFIREYAETLKFENDILIFAGLKTSEEVALLMQDADCIVQFSNYESAGVVIQEALVSGTPVISSKVGIASDYINNTNGILVDPQNEIQLRDAINLLLDNAGNYNHQQIREKAKECFSYSVIAKKFMEVYNDVLKNSNKNDKNKGNI